MRRLAKSNRPFACHQQHALPARRLRPLLRLSLFLFVLPTLLIDSSAAQSDATQASPQRLGETETGDTVEIQVSELGEPPSTIKALMERGDVRLLTGTQPQSAFASTTTNRRLAGQTEFHLNYRYDSRARWQIENARAGNSRGEPVVRIHVRFRLLKMILSHEVWLKNPPSGDAFWKDPVVRHEFDHVRISSDPRIESYFIDQTKTLKQFRVPISQVRGSTGRVENAKVQSLIDARMQGILDKTTDYVRIRYRELDRLTDHGLKPIPQDREQFFSVSPEEVADRE